MSLFKRMKEIWRANQAECAEPPQRTLTSLKVGDIVTYELVDYKVEGVTTYRHGSQERYGFLLTDGVQARYMIVEEKETLRVQWFETLEARLQNPEEINNEMIFEDKSYFEFARGESSVSVVGKSAFSSYDIVYWWLHKADGGGLMLFEWQKGEIVIRAGHAVKPFEIQVLAGSE